MDSGDVVSKIMMMLPIFLLIISMTSDARVISPECHSSMCGNINIPYPWGTEGCPLNSSYSVTCNNSFTPSKLFVGNTNVEILNISIYGELTVLLYAASQCYDEKGVGVTTGRSTANLGGFRVSHTRNKFFAIGCDTLAVINGTSVKDVTTGCLSVCQNEKSVINGSCSGIGCCQTSIPKGVLYYVVSVTSFNKPRRQIKGGFSPCSYAFLAEENSFNFSTNDLARHSQPLRTPVIFEWDIGIQRCAALNTSTNVCLKSLSTCYDTDNGLGYRCNCSNGYQGNPYVPNGCKDIDECQYPNLTDDCQKQYCINTQGGFTCECPVGYNGNGRGEPGCVADPKKRKSNLMIILITGIGAAGSIVALLMCGYCFYLASKKRKLIELKHNFFRQNGGLMLQQKLTTHEGYNETTKIYTKEELEMATNMYDEKRIIGRGGFGTVYKGIFPPPDNRVVAIKKSKLVDKSQIEQFINEVVVLSQVNHRNVVKLLGCCLETQVPLLVYEFVSNGTLFEHIHSQALPPMSWDSRLMIAADTAGVLAYLHSSASIPIIHRDIKSANILLDENYIAKVADFGASRLVPLGQDEISTMVQGTLGYLDPEYLQTSQLTEKSDVYSFGVVLVELLTGRKPLLFDLPETHRCLAHFFLASLKEDELFPILESVVSKEANSDQVIQVANLAKLCLRVKGDDRPTMKEVAMELESLRVMMGKQKHVAWLDDDNAAHLEELEKATNSDGVIVEEEESLLGDISIDSATYNSGNAAISVDNSAHAR